MLSRAVKVWGLDDAKAARCVSHKRAQVQTGTFQERFRGPRLWVAESSQYWVVVKGFGLSCHNKETTLFTIDPYYGNLTLKPLKEPL